MIYEEDVNKKFMYIKERREVKKYLIFVLEEGGGNNSLVSRSKKTFKEIIK